MAWIQVDASCESQIEKILRHWRNDQPRKPGQLGGTIWSDVRGGPNLDNTIDWQLPDAFVNERLEGSGIAFRRR